MKAQIPSETLTAIKQALLKGRKIEAIKLYREHTKSTLADAKVVIDKLEDALHEASPDEAAPKTEGTGCQGVLVMILALAALAAIWWLVR